MGKGLVISEDEKKSIKKLYNLNEGIYDDRNRISEKIKVKTLSIISRMYLILTRIKMRS